MPNRPDDLNNDVTDEQVRGLGEDSDEMDDEEFDDTEESDEEEEEEGSF